MTEVIIRNLLWVQVMHSNIHVQTGLRIIHRDAALLEVLSSTPHTVRNCLITRRHPAALDLRLLLLIPILLLILTKHSGNSFDSLLGVNLLILASRPSSFIKLTQSPTSHRVVSFTISLKPSFKLRDIVGVLLLWRMLGEGRLEIAPVHDYFSLILNLFSIILIDDVVVSLHRFNLRVRVDGSTFSLTESLIVRFTHFT